MNPTLWPLPASKERETSRAGQRTNRPGTIAHRGVGEYVIVCVVRGRYSTTAVGSGAPFQGAS